MADAVPVNPAEDVAVPEVAPKVAKKGASAGISADVLAEIKAQLKEELRAEMAPSVPTVELGPDAFKVKGGVPLESHQAKREDF